MALFKKVLFVLFSLLLLLIAVLLVNTLSFTSRQFKTVPVENIPVHDSVLQHLSGAVTFQTVSKQDAQQFQGDEFLKFHSFLAKTFPTLHAALQKEVIGNYSLLYRWQGSNTSLLPVMLTAHQDVVPVTEPEKWSAAPFEGKIQNDSITGRGILDDKSGVMGIMEAAEILMKQGFKPERTIYFAFGHDEETGGTNGAKRIAELLKQRGIRFESILDEGGTVLKGAVAGLDVPVALVGIAEKGYATVELSVETESGHSSMPPPQTAIGILCKAVAELEKIPFPAEIKGTVKMMFDYMAPEMNFFSRLVFANRWLSEPLILKKLSSSASTNAAIRTTMAATIIEGGTKENVLPLKATALLNIRILPGDNQESIIRHVRKAIDNPLVKIRFKGTYNSPSSVSDIHAPSFTTLQQTIGELFPETITAPYLTLASTDAKHYSELSSNIYRFLPIFLESRELSKIHGTDEKTSVENYKNTVRFYIQYLKNVNLYRNPKSEKTTNHKLYKTTLLN